MTPAIGIIVIGDELLSGRRQDKHLPHVIEKLAAHDLILSWAYYLGDDEQQLSRMFRFVCQTSDICISFGGIGATPDDVTRQAMAVAHDVELVRHPEAVDEIEAQFGAAAYPNRILMADLPGGAVLIPNPFNRIPGFSLGDIHCLPGFPEMAWPMLDWLLDEYYSELSVSGVKYASLIVTDVHESELVMLLSNFQAAHPQLKISSLPRFLENGKSQIELGITGEAALVDKALRELEKALKASGYLTNQGIPSSS